MALSIQNRKTEELAREVAVLKNKPIAAAVHDALLRERRYEKSLKRKKMPDDFMDQILGLQARVAKLPLLDSRHPDEILYDEFGLPK